jgi:hypothetical protein
MLDPVAHDRQTALAPWAKARRRGWPSVARATPSLRPSTPGAFSSRLSLPSHLDCRAAIERYLQHHRPILARGNADTARLWLAMNGKPMSCASIAELIPETTEMSVGVRVNPHLFRTAGVTTLATRAGDKPHAGSALLHHRPGPVTQENYNRASCLSAGKSLAAVRKAYRVRKS